MLQMKNEMLNVLLTLFIDFVKILQLNENCGLQIYLAYGQVLTSFLFTTIFIMIPYMLNQKHLCILSSPWIVLIVIQYVLIIESIDKNVFSFYEIIFHWIKWYYDCFQKYLIQSRISNFINRWEILNKVYHMRNLLFCVIFLLCASPKRRSMCKCACASHNKIWIANWLIEGKHFAFKRLCTHVHGEYGRNTKFKPNINMKFFSWVIS